MEPRSTRVATPAFSEKAFYLSEFRGRTLALAAAAEDLARPAALEAVLKELEANATRSVLISDDRERLAALLAAPVVASDSPRLEGAVWRGLADSPRVGVCVDASQPFAGACGEIALRLRVSKLLWLDRDGGLRAPDGGRESFLDLDQLRQRLGAGLPDEPPRRVAILREIERVLGAGLPAVNLTSQQGLADELFTYAGSGTLFTRERYLVVRRLGLDDFDAAHDLFERGVAEGYLAPRSADQVEQILAGGFGAFVEGRHLAGIGALIDHPDAGAGEIASLYTLTRFLGEGVGAHLVRFALEQARAVGRRYVFACTTSPRVAGFFEREGFRVASADELPDDKWRGYDPERRRRLTCLRRDLVRPRTPHGPRRGSGSSGSGSPAPAPARRRRNGEGRG